MLFAEAEKVLDLYQGNSRPSINYFKSILTELKYIYVHDNISELSRGLSLLKEAFALLLEEYLTELVLGLRKVKDS